MVLEAVIMLIVMIVAARRVIQRFNVLQTFASTISMGSFVTVSSLVSQLMFLLLAAMPTLVMRAGRSRLSEIS